MTAHTSVCSPLTVTSVLSSAGPVPLPTRPVLVSTRSLLLGDSVLPVRSDPVASPVMETPGQRWRQRVAERDSGLSNPEQEAEIDIAYLKSVTCGRCSGCGIYIGPDHYEKSYYFSFVRNQYIDNFDDTISWIGEEGYLVFYCGGCAQKHGVSSEQRLLDRGHCETNYLLIHSLKPSKHPLTQHEVQERAEKQQVTKHVREYILEQFRTYALLTMICYKINFRFAFYSYQERQMEEARLRAAAKAKAEAQRQKRIAQARRKQQEQQDRSLIKQIAIPTLPTPPRPTRQPEVMNVRATDLFQQRCHIGSSALPA